MAENMVAEEKQTLISKKDLVKAWWRWTTAVEVPVSFDRMQALAFGYSMNGVMRKIYKDKPEELKDAMKRHTSMFNTNCDWGSIIHGITISLEEQRALGHEDEITPEMIQSLKIGLMGPLAGIGDSFIWGTLRIIATGVGLSLANQGNILGPILFLLIFNIPAQGLRYYLMNAGYKLGSGFLAKIQENGLMSKLTYAASVLGLMVVGGMTAENVSINFPLAFGSGDEATTLNDVFNNIMPGLMPLLFTLLVYYLLKKKNIKTTTLLLICVVIGLVGSFFGILGC